MKVMVSDNNLIISVSGVKSLKLSTEIRRRGIKIEKVTANEIILSVRSIHIIADLLDAEAFLEGDLKEVKEKYKNHELARKVALDIIEKAEIAIFNNIWDEILDPKQTTAVAAIVVKHLIGACLFDEQGSGKTVMAISTFDILRDRDIIDAMIVVCPKSMIGEWEGDIRKFLQNKYKINVADGDASSKYQSVMGKFDILITNYEGINLMSTTLIGSSSIVRYLLVIDESFYVKNAEATRSEVLKKVRWNCNKCLVMCGTPAPNSAEDIINQMNLADLEFSFNDYVPSIDESENRTEISNRLKNKGMVIRRLKGDILEFVPEKRFHVIRVKMTGRQEVMYEIARNSLELELKSLSNEAFKRSIATYFQRRSTLLQICCCPNAIDPIFSEEPAKYKAIDELLNELVANGRKVVIWSFYRASLDEMEKRYEKFGLVRVDGSVPVKERRRAVSKFQNELETRLFLGNPAAAGAGITLHAAYDAIYVSYSNQAAHYLQSLDRIHRRGQKSDLVNYYMILCEGSIEETELMRLREKEISQHEILGDYVKWPSTLDEALLELKRGE